jgi:hypothetical protein
MRPSDQEEIRISEAASGNNIYDNLCERVHLDYYFTLWRDDEIVAIGGITPSTWTNKVGIIWLLGTNLADKHWRSMTRFCRSFIDASRSEYEGIGNYVPADATKRIEWLSYLGFDINEQEAHISDYRFRGFYLDLCGPDVPNAAP